MSLRHRRDDRCVSQSNVPSLWLSNLVADSSILPRISRALCFIFRAKRRKLAGCKLKEKFINALTKDYVILAKMQGGEKERHRRCHLYWILSNYQDENSRLG